MEDHSMSNYRKNDGLSISTEMPFFRILSTIVSWLPLYSSLDITIFSTCWLRKILPMVRDLMTMPLSSLFVLSLTVR